MTYVGIGTNRLEAFKTLVLADSDEEAWAKVLTKLNAWCGDDYAREDVMIRAFGDGRRV